MSRIEIITPEGYRKDGRLADTLRQMIAETITSGRVDGGAVFHCGNTNVRAEIDGPSELPANRRKPNCDDVLVTVNVNVPPFASPMRQQAIHKDKKLNDVATLIKNVFNRCIVRHKYPQTEIIINLTVMSHDGGLAATCVNAAYLALVQANIQMRETVAAMNSGILQGQVLLHLNYDECGSIPEFTLVIGESTHHIYGLNYFNRSSIAEHEKLIRSSILAMPPVFKLFRDTLEYQYIRQSRVDEIIQGKVL
eukprot:GHVH01013141.1.p2 GENE.GHVH01013141.1~~GHVH01013141.1.p2  ORF type:complete len:251 (+),score=29.35 GHVH01013141.1:1407-2159(+)